MSRFSLFDVVLGTFGTVLLALVLATFGVGCFALCRVWLGV